MLSPALPPQSLLTAGLQLCTLFEEQDTPGSQDESCSGMHAIAILTRQNVNVLSYAGSDGCLCMRSTPALISVDLLNAQKSISLAQIETHCVSTCGGCVTQAMVVLLLLHLLRPSQQAKPMGALLPVSSGSPHRPPLGPLQTSQCLRTSLPPQRPSR